MTMVTEQAATVDDPASVPGRPRRVVLKLSGEALMGKQAYGIEVSTVERIAADIKAAAAAGAQLCLVIGGGNIFRGLSGAAAGTPLSSRWSTSTTGMTTSNRKYCRNSPPATAFMFTTTLSTRTTRWKRGCWPASPKKKFSVWWILLGKAPRIELG